MIEHPILFSAPMVRAILAGRKTQTRRVVRLPRHVLARGIDPRMTDWLPKRYTRGSGQYPGGNPNFTGDQPPGLLVTCLDGTCQRIACSFGHRGDRLWVKETWRLAPTMYPYDPYWYRADFTRDDPAMRVRGIHASWCQGANGVDCMECWENRNGRFRWTSSIFMPRRASRITLNVVDVRVEQLHAITEDDAKSEGVEPLPAHGQWCDPTRGREGHLAYRLAFRTLWDAINAKRGHGWDSNPWVWAITFRRIA